MPSEELYFKNIRQRATGSDAGDDRYALDVMPRGGALVTDAFDYIGASYPNDTTDVFTYKLGGSGGTTVAIVTVVYTDDTKETISTVART